MKQILLRRAAGLLATLLLFTLVPITACAAEPAATPTPIGDAPGLKGLHVSTTRGKDFPGRAGLSADAQKRELDALLAFARTCGFDTVFYEAVSNAAASYHSGQYEWNPAVTSGYGLLGRFDPLAYLTKQAAGQEIRVVAVVDPFLVSDSGQTPSGRKSPAVRNKGAVQSVGGKLYFDPADANVQKLLTSTVKELVKNYALSGIALRGFAFPSADSNLTLDPAAKQQTLSSLLDRVGAEAGEVPVGLAVDEAFPMDDAEDRGFAPALWAGKGQVSFLLPQLNQTVADGYAEQLAQWKTLADAAGLPLYAGNLADRVLAPRSDLDYFGDPMELSYQLFLNRQLGADGSVVYGYGAIRDNFFGAAEQLSASFTPQEDFPALGFDLSIPDGFAVTRPAQNLTTTYASYYIMGTYDGQHPVFLDGREAARGSRTFGILVQLQPGENSFTLECGGEQRTVLITRSDGSAAPISAIRQSTVFPWQSEGVRVGEEFQLSCTAPSGASVSARLEGRDIPLKQAAAAAPGMPVLFTASVTLGGDYTADETVRLGSLTYTSNYNGATAKTESLGTLSAVGADARFAVEVTDMRGDTSAANNGAEFRDNMIVSVEQGAVDYVTGQNIGYYQLSCGGWIDKEDVRVIEGKADIDAKVTGPVTLARETSGETFRMPATQKPYYRTELTDSALTVTLYNTSGVPGDWNSLGSKLFSGIDAAYDAEQNRTTLTFAVEHGPLWGYNVEFHDGEIWIFAKNTPVLSDTFGKPLEGVTIIVDAGHGGNDPGALGVAGLSGPAEKQLNYFNACALTGRLRALGATVHMTQTADERLSYERRMDIARDERADFYLSLHHNSTVESADSTNAKGIEVYYMEDLAVPFATTVAEELSASTGRRNRGALFATFRVTQMTHTPSLLVELGYMVSPSEYESLCTPLGIYRAAVGIADGVVRTIREAGASEPVPAASVGFVARSETAESGAT